MGLTKTVYNPEALKAAQKSSEEAVKKKQVRRGMVGNGEWRDLEFRPQTPLDSHTNTEGSA